VLCLAQLGHWMGQTNEMIERSSKPKICETDLLGIPQGLHDKDVDLFLHQQGLDTSTSVGKAMFQMLGVFAEFERGII
jgi:Resolvase, N terminal domain